MMGLATSSTTLPVDSFLPVLWCWNSTGPVESQSLSLEMAEMMDMMEMEMTEKTYFSIDEYLLKEGMLGRLMKPLR